MSKQLLVPGNSRARSRRISPIWLISLALLGLLAAGCGREQGAVAPSLSAISPNQGMPGATLAVTLSGANFSTGATLNISSASILATQTAVVSSGQITAQFAIAAGAAPGPAQISVTSAGETTNTVTFTVLAPLTVSSTTPNNGATGVAINLPIAATFDVAPQCATLNTASFTLAAASGGAVAGTVSCSGATATFTPVHSLASGTAYIAILSTSISNAQGATLAAPYSWNFTTQPAPAVISTNPAAGATGLALTPAALAATFNQTINCATVTTASFTMTSPLGASVPGTVACAGAGAAFTPNSNLTANTIYTLTFSTAVQSPTGAALAGAYQWNLKTGPGAPVTPTVIATIPLNGATGVPINEQLTAAFNEAMNPATINATSFTLAGPGGAPVTGAVSYVAPGSVATFAPTAALAGNSTYVATITTAVNSLGGQSMAANYTWSFTTGAAPNTTKPTILSTIAANAATGVPINQAVSATFSQAMNPATINSLSFTLAPTIPAGPAVTGLVTYSVAAQTATFSPTANLLANTTYSAQVTSAAQDLAGNPLGQGGVPNPWTFTTAATVNTTPPTIVTTNPASAAINVPVNATVNATFSEAMDPLSITTNSFQLLTGGGAAVGGTVAYDAADFIATFTPTNPLTAGGTYTATVTNAVTDLAGIPLGPGAVPNPWSFTVATAVLPAVNLGTASTFGGFGSGAGMTNSGVHTVINGNIGTTGASTLMTGFHDNGANCTYTETTLNIGLVNGIIYTAPPPPTVGCPTEGTAATMAIATQAAADALTAFNATSPALMPPTVAAQASELGGLTLAPGIYQSATGSFSIANGDLTLDAQGNANAVWVFQTASTLTVGIAGPAGFRNVILLNGAQAKNVYWHVGSAATINGGGGGTMVGTILAYSAITFSTAGLAAITTLDGRALALNALVSMNNTVINVPLP